MTRDFPFNIASGGQLPGNNGQVIVQLDGVISVTSIQMRNASPLYCDVYSGQGTNTYLFTILPYENSTTYLGGQGGGSGYLQLTLQFRGNVSVASQILVVVTDEILTSQSSSVPIPSPGITYFMGPMGGHLTGGAIGDRVTFSTLSPGFSGGGPSVALNQTVYITDLFIKGLEFQRLWWVLNINIGATSSFQAINWRGDFIQTIKTPMSIFANIAAYTGSLAIQIQTLETYIPTLNPVGMVAGYIQ